MIISYKYKFIFIKTRKTAGSSIQMYLSELCDEKDIITPIDKPEQHYRARNYHGLFNPLPRILEQRNSPQKILLTFWRFLKLMKFHSHISAKHIKMRISGDIWDTYYKFCIERNPWDKVLSHYHYVRQRFKVYNQNITFDEYLQSAELPYNYDIYTNSNCDIMVDRVVKYENLNEGLAEVFENLGIPFSGTLSVYEKSHYRKDKNNYRSFYSPEQKSLIEKLFTTEIELHGYEF